MKKRTAKKILRRLPIWAVVIIAILTAAYFILNYMGYSIYDLFKPAAEPLDGIIKVHIIDVGQADSILIETPEGVMLIDAGTSSSETALEAYLTALGIREIDYFVITHAHDDHDGGADMIFDEFKVKNLIYEDYGYSNKKLDMFTSSGATIIDPEVRDIYTLGEAKFTVMSPDIEEDTGDKNDYSIVLRLDYGATSFMFTGDATTYTEGLIMDEFSNYELDCDFLKSGHHGSTTSSGKKFLDALTPDTIAISVGEGNSYGLPKQDILNRYDEMRADVHRTDLLGDLVYVSNGAEITFEGNSDGN